GLALAHRSIERVSCRSVFAKPVAGLPQAREASRLAQSPLFSWSCQRERPLVEVDRRATFHPPPGAVGGGQQGVAGSFGRGAIAGIEVERGERRKLPMVGRP